MHRTYVFVGYYVAPALERLYEDFSALLVVDDLGVPFRADTSRHLSTTTDVPITGKLPHMKESKVPDGIRNHSGEGQVILGHGSPYIMANTNVTCELS